MKKCPSNIGYHDLNPQPFEHESSPITTRQGLRPNVYYFYIISYLGQSEQDGIDQILLLNENRLISLTQKVVYYMLTIFYKLAVENTRN